jgi:hypothetical protein
VAWLFGCLWPGCYLGDQSFARSVWYLVRDYNCECMVAYRNSVRYAIVLAACLARWVGHLEREFARLIPVDPGLPGGQLKFDWHLLCSLSLFFCLLLF